MLSCGIARMRVSAASIPAARDDLVAPEHRRIDQRKRVVDLAGRGCDTAHYLDGFGSNGWSSSGARRYQRR